MKNTKKSNAKPKPSAKDLTPKKSAKGGVLLTTYKFAPALSSPPSSLQMQSLETNFVKL